MLILTEKFSVAKDFAEAFRAGKFEGYFKAQDVTITYCQGHFFDSCPLSFCDKKFEKWNVADLPIIPQKLCYEKIPAAAKQAESIRQRISLPYPTSASAEKTCSASCQEISSPSVWTTANA